MLWVKRFSCVLCVCLWMGRCGGPRGSTARLTTSRSGAPGRTVREVEDLRKGGFEVHRV